MVQLVMDKRPTRTDWLQLSIQRSKFTPLIVLRIRDPRAGQEKIGKLKNWKISDRKLILKFSFLCFGDRNLGH